MALERGYPRVFHVFQIIGQGTLAGHCEATLPLAVTDLADAVIDNFLKHQALNTTKREVAGELPMIISGKAFLHTTTFGSADSTFLFPWAIRELRPGNSRRCIPAKKVGIDRETHRLWVSQRHRWRRLG